MGKSKCSVCGKEFKDEESLSMHHAAKHTTPEPKQSSIDSRKLKTYGLTGVVVIVIIGLIVWAFVAASGNAAACQTAPAEEINIGGHTNLAMHIHPFMQIIIDGQQQVIPANIGISTSVMRPIHTHDSSGELHLEGPCERDFTVGEFFDVWGRQFDSQCLFGTYCTDEGALTMTVNGEQNDEFRNYEMKDGDSIIITYTSTP